jgi:hypothetical protein
MAHITNAMLKIVPKNATKGNFSLLFIPNTATLASKFNEKRIIVKIM